jgi:hypothetical protein
VVKTGNQRVARFEKKKNFAGKRMYFCFFLVQMFSTVFFLATAIFCRGCVEFERLCFCVRTSRIWSQIFSERGVGSGWRRGGMAEDVYVREDRRWYRLVVIVGGYLLV